MTSSTCRVLRGSQRDSSDATSSASSRFARPCFEMSFLSAVSGIDRDIGGFVQQHALALAILIATVTRTEAMLQRTGALRVVPYVDYQRYAGTWYEIARLPNR